MPCRQGRHRRCPKDIHRRWRKTHIQLWMSCSKISTLNLQRVRQIKSRVVAISGRAQEDHVASHGLYIMDKICGAHRQVRLSSINIITRQPIKQCLLTLLFSKKMHALIERRSTSIAPLQTPSPMAQTRDPRNSMKESPQPPRKQGFMSFFSCKYNETAVEVERRRKKKKKKRSSMGWSGSLCSLRESSKVMQRPDPTPPPTEICNQINGATPRAAGSSSFSSCNLSASIGPSSSSSSLGGSFRGMHLRRFSGCYECHMVVDPINGVSRVPSLRRSSVFPCPECGEVFTKSESLEFHQAVKHAVSGLGPEDTSRNVVEIIFKTSWLKKQATVCKIERILKVHHTQKTIKTFESYRDSIKSKASRLTKKHPRCIADGNELLRFHCASLSCSLGLNGSTSLCPSTPGCGVCSVVRDGFKPDALGKIGTMAASGRAHDTARLAADGKEKAMLVCRVIAGRVKKNDEGSEEFDSVAGSAGVYGNLDELFVFDPKSILPCFVVIYRSL